MNRPVSRQKVRTYSLPNGEGPAVMTAELREMEADAVELEAWIGNFGASNVYIFAGDVTLAQAQAKVTTKGEVDALLALSESAPVSGTIDPGIRRLTIFFEALQNAGQSQSVCIKLYEHYFEA